jgi:hypothetical protein
MAGGERLVRRALRSADDESLRLFVAGCAERLAQMFCVLRASDPGRDVDISHVVEALEELWDRGTPASSFVTRWGRLEVFPELTSADDEVPIDDVDVFSFHAALVLLHAVGCATTGDRKEAQRCSQAALTAMAHLGSGPDGTDFLEEELARQVEVVAMFGHGVSAAEARSRDYMFGRRRVEALLGQINSADPHTIDAEGGRRRRAARSRSG